jgi:hypothetical protein
MPTIPIEFPPNCAVTITRLLREATAPGFFGEVVLIFQSGAFVLGRVVRTEKPAPPTEAAHG